ncbi:multidrug effflux MFS transporter [Rhizosaccharibacter radicis]|uniref:Bcr/CflA family efflux transporter n=1 Tax=Rhizosaccharibacter radicis TaxID=2782605 RepID=A0ABT1W2Z1_9PROT|nr:multidrug effflux MFS transporter [Acetobacteraceae bacterium KSS12]
MHLILLLGALSGVGPLSTDMYLPAFPALERDLGGAAGSAEVTLAAWFAGLAVGQFSTGPMSDRWGRRAPLLLGMAIYALASVGCVFAHDVWSFSLCRFLSAIGGASGMVIPRAVVRDVATGAPGARIMSQLTLVLGVVPILAPTLGGMVLGAGTWRTIFWVTTAYGVLAMMATFWLLPDTLPRSARVRLPPSEVLIRYIQIGRERTFLASTAVTAMSTFVLFGYLSGAPVAFEKVLGFTPTQFGMLFGVNAAFYIAGTQINARLVHRIGLKHLLVGGVGALLASAVLLMLLTLTGMAGAGRPAILTMVPVAGCLASIGFITPNAVVLALAAHARHAGSASALMGTLQFTFGALSGVLMGLSSAPSILPMACVILLGACGAALAGRWRLRMPDPALF